MTLHQQQLTDTATTLLEAANKIFLAIYGQNNNHINEAMNEIDQIDDDSSTDDIEYHTHEAINAIEFAAEFSDLRDGYLNGAYQATLTAATNAIEELRETDYNETDDETDND